ncbi:MAG: helix-turn-helix domain-containing protein [Patescibacteria group bacterium]
MLGKKKIISNGDWSKSLHGLGLTAQEARLYLYLLKKKEVSAETIRRDLRIPIQSVYRSARNLKGRDLISEIPEWPLMFIAKPPKIALADLVQNKTREMQLLIEALTGAKPRVHRQKPVGPTKVNLIFNPQELFLSSAAAINKAKREILVISIGEELPEELVLAQRRAIERGVTSRMVAHRYDSSNREILHNFKRNGIDVRHYPDWGFHLVVVDEECAILAANNPKKTSERVGIEFFSIGLAKALRDYFYSVWNRAKVIL